MSNFETIKQKRPMTEAGSKLLRQELYDLKTFQRPKIIEAISEARAHGDLKENAEYHAAKEKQAFIEGRIIEVESKLANAQIINVTKIPNQGKVIFGATVHLINIENGKVLKYQIVGEDEADIKYNKISVCSPIARALIGKKEGNLVDVKTPTGFLTLEITKIEYI